MINLDITFGALADPIRRDILLRLSKGEESVGNLAEPFGVSLPAISRHLKVLEEAELIVNERRGKHRFCRLRPGPLADAQNWLDFHRAFWDGSFDRLDEHLARNPQGEKK